MVDANRSPQLDTTLRRTAKELRALCNTLEQELQGAEAAQDGCSLEQLCPDLFGIAPVGLFVASLDGALLHANPAMAEMLCYPSPEQLLHAVGQVGKQLFVAPESFAILASTLQQHTTAHLAQVQALGCGGQARWFNVHARLLCNHSRPEDLALFAVEDVSEQVQRDNQERQEHLRYKTLFENAAEALFQCTPDGKLLMANKALARLFACESLDELYDRCPDLPCLLHDPTVFGELVSQLRSTGAVNGFETRGIRRNDTFWIGCNADIVHDQRGEPLLLHGSLRDITAQKNLEAKLLREGYRDAVTGLANRSMFLNLLDKSIARAKRRDDFGFALVAIQLDSFRSVKQSLGHQVAEEMLTQVSRRLVEQLRTEDTCARLGNDEFGLLLSDVLRPADAIRVLERINAALEKPLDVQDNELFPRMSSGIVFCDDPGTPESMLDDADTALYRAKADPVQRFAVFNEAMQREATERLRTETDLRKALEREELLLFYQPIISVHQGRVVGFEALLRWQRPGVGLVPPDTFVPTLEETGLIVEAGEWALQQACRQARAWQRAFAQHEGLMVNVNISPRQLLGSQLVDSVQRCLRDSGLDAHCLKLEITENLFVEEPHKAMHTLTELKDLGVSIAIDDFGTGYSSLSYLNRLPADTLKIDKSFVQAMRGEQNGQAIVRTIKLLADSLGKDVVAEGVETSEQLTTIMQLQCAYVQGYYFSKPLPADDARALLSRGLEP